MVYLIVVVNLIYYLLMYYKIESLADTLIAPLTLYSKTYSSLDALKEAAGLKNN